MPCHNICTQLPHRPFRGHHITRSYKEGYRGCSNCYVMILLKNWLSPFCPCCGQKVRSKSKHGKNRKTQKTSTSLDIICATPQIIAKA